MLSIQNLSVKLDNFNLSNISFEIEKGDYFVLAGPSGSGKTILLEAIAGIHEKNTSGEIFLNKLSLRNKKIQERNVGLVFQDNTLFPHLSVKKNILFAHHLRGQQNDENKLFENICSVLLLTDLLQRDPKTLSGGEIRRVLLARTLASEPEIILLDEPLSGVDTRQKDQLKGFLRDLNRKGQTIIHVTHDFEEAFSLANKMGIMHEGRIEGLGSPKEILDKPGNSFVARFCGYKNFFQAKLNSSGEMVIAGKIALKLKPENSVPEIRAVIIDESKIELYDKGASPDQNNLLKGKIRDLFPSVHGTEMVIDIGVRINAVAGDNNLFLNPPEVGDEIWCRIPESSVRLLFS